MLKANRTRVVVFTETNARVIKTLTPNKYKNRPGVLIEPDLEAVRGTAPEFWTFKGGKVVPMNRRERQLRRAMIEKKGIVSTIPPKLHSKPRKWLWLTLLALGAVSGVLYAILV